MASFLTNFMEQSLFQKLKFSYEIVDYFVITPFQVDRMAISQVRQNLIKSFQWLFNIGPRVSKKAQ